MSEAAQILLYVVILVLLGILVVIGVQVFLLLRDLKLTILKTNKVLDNTEEITSSIKNPVNSFSSLIMGLSAGASILNIVNRKSDDVEKKEKKDGK